MSDNLEEGLESGQEEEPEDDENDNDEVVEPLIDAYGDHVNTVIYLGLAPLTLTLLILFRTQTQARQSDGPVRSPSNAPVCPQIAITYSIKEDNLRYYLMFSAMIIPFVVVYNAFVVNILELFHGYRITAYLKYCQFAFQARDQRWCACETSMDMGIAEPLRSIHQMAFSSQYSLSVFVGACGMIMVAVGVEAEVRLNFNVFGDPVYPIVVTIAFLIGIVIVKLCRFLADIVGLWRVRSRHSPRVKRDSKKVGWIRAHCHIYVRAAARGADWLMGTQMKITDWEEIEHMAAVAKMQLQAEMRRIETPRLLDSDFRDDFIKFNRVWLVLHLEEVRVPVCAPSIIRPELAPSSRLYLRGTFVGIGRGRSPNSVASCSSARRRNNRRSSSSAAIRPVATNSKKRSKLSNTLASTKPGARYAPYDGRLHLARTLT